MPAPFNLNGFAHGETVQFSVRARRPGGAVLTTPGTATVILTIGATVEGEPIVQFSTGTGHIVLADAGTAEFDVTLQPADLAEIAEGTAYWYNIWTIQGAEKRKQAYGRFVLKRSILPT